MHCDLLIVCLGPQPSWQEPQSTLSAVTLPAWLHWVQSPWDCPIPVGNSAMALQA